MAIDLYLHIPKQMGDANGKAAGAWDHCINRADA